MLNQVSKLTIALGIAVATCTAQKESLLIGPGDLLHVQVLDTPEMDQHVRVTDAGTVHLAFIGDLKVSDLTPEDVAHAVEQALVQKQYMHHPQVMTTVDQYATQNVSVMGQVATPGSYPIATPQPILKVLSLAGGLTELADRHISIQRQGDSKDRMTYYLSNESQEAFNSQVLIYPGDTVLIPKAGLVYVLGDVSRPGGFPITTNDAQMSALEAIALAGSTNKTSLADRAKLIRKTSSGIQQILLKLDAMQSGKTPDFNLQPNDVIFVPFSWMKNIALNGSAIAASTSSAAIYAVR